MSSSSRFVSSKFSLFCFLPLIFLLGRGEKNAVYTRLKLECRLWKPSSGYEYFEKNSWLKGKVARTTAASRVGPP